MLGPTASSPSTRKGRRGAPAAVGEKQAARKIGHDNARKKNAFKAAPRRTRDVLGYRTMLPSGVAWLGADEWSMTVRISDINYVAASQEHQESIVDRWARFLNSYGAGTRVQETVINRVLDDVDVAALLHKPLLGDEFDQYRADSNRIVRDKLAAASGNTVTDKYLTVTVQEPDREKAEATLTRIGHEMEGALSAMNGCRVQRLDRAERLAVLAHIVRPHELFTFTEQAFADAGRRATHDYIAPWALEDKDKDGPIKLVNGSGETFHTVLWVRDYPVWLSDRLITELTEIKCELTVSLHLEPYDQIEGMGLVERQISELEMQTITERKKAKKQGIGEDMIPQKLVDALDEARTLRQELSQSNQKVFATVMVIGVSAGTRELLEQNVKRAMTVIRKQSVTAEVLRYMQLDGLTTELPIGRRAIPMRRTLTTSSAAIIVPFTTQELFVPGGHWYGTNADSSNAIVADRTQTKNGNGFIMGTSGSGKGVFGKQEIGNTFLSRLQDEIIIIDPEREYEPLVEAFQGATIRVHPGSQDRINAMDIDLDVALDEDPIAIKSAFVLSVLESEIGGATGLTPVERSIADRVTVQLYKEYAAERAAGRGVMPTFNTLREALITSGEPEARKLATALEIYTTGSLGGFSQQTNVNPRARIVSWDISRLGAQLKSFGMMVILDQIWTRVVRNRDAGIRTWIYVDEFHLLFKDQKIAEQFREIWARIRKYGGIPTGITQNIEAVLANESARLMLANSDFLAILGQTETDADSLSELLHLSPEQRRKFENVLPGQGLLKSGSHVLGFDSRIPDDGPLYALYETNFKERPTEHK
ncbi:VirB4-like conjugal transfer ATPase, CD1110 family [Microbacterium sp. TPU 3598]|uniref:VirB4-like conjugal transfer ATPase, CD1110 family n=1 Tax=Microbacterium sp. TPU 3598 TaxID=1938334 RepID=UPI000BBAF774|nr:type IV secretion system protein VirB4 [Microbacterium sp. TPU 3598]